MAEDRADAVSLNTLHEDLNHGFAEMRSGFAELKTEMRAGFTDLKTTLVAGFRSLPSRESSEETVRLLREGNRLQEERFTQLDLRIREQHLETQQVLHAVVEGQHALVEGQRGFSADIRNLAADIRALIARLDTLIRGRGDGGRTSVS
jgi:hypothetical protein